MDRPPVMHNPSAYGVATDGDGIADRRGSAQRSMPRHHTQMLPFETIDRRVRCPAHPGGVLGHGLHDRLQIGRRARDHPQDLACGGLLLQRLLRLVEQADVLDRDHGLVGEGLEESHLRIRERTDLATVNDQHADERAVSEEGHLEESSNSFQLDRCHPERVALLISRLRSDVYDVDWEQILKNPRQGCPRARLNPPPAQKLSPGRSGAAHGYGFKRFAVVAKQRAKVGFAEPCRVGEDRLEHWREIGGRSADDPQDLRRRGLLLQRLGQRLPEAFDLALRICV